MSEERVREFRVTADTAMRRNRRANIRLAMWGVFATTLAVILSGTGFAHRLLNSAEGLGALVVLLVLLGSFLWIFRNAQDVIARETAFILTDTYLIRKRTGHPNIQIDVTEMKLYLRPGWLVVESADPLRKIAIPEDVSRFEFLRTELAKHAPAVRLPGRSSAINLFIGSVLGLALVLVSIISWALVLESRYILASSIAATIGTGLLAWQSFLLSRHFRNDRERPFLLAWIGFQWLAAALIIGLRLLRS